MWQLQKPDIYADIILYDEAQDANGCMLDIVNSQAGSSQLIFVGDTYQQIYTWNGAVNALALASPEAPRSRLTESFRFGEGIAMFANKALEWLDAPVGLTGRGPSSFVGVIAKPDVILFRTNGAAVAKALEELKAGGRPALVGGADDVVTFARAAEQLKAGLRVQHPELACFDTWGEVQDYVAHDPNGSELRMLVDLVDNYGADVIVDGLGRCVDEARASVVLSTAHKAKGREWDAVQLAGDFPDPAERDVSDEDVRLLYVAATRAKKMLDPTRVGFFDFQREERQ
jgi:superfamily I DNA/RNA helicase